MGKQQGRNRRRPLLGPLESRGHQARVRAPRALSWGSRREVQGTRTEGTRSLGGTAAVRGTPPAAVCGGFDLFHAGGSFTVASGSQGTDCCLSPEVHHRRPPRERTQVVAEGGPTSCYRNYISLSALQGAEAEDTVWPRRRRAAGKAI